MFEVDPNTVLHWLMEAAEQLRAFAQYFLHDLHLTQVQLDELYAVLSALKDGTMSEGNRSGCQNRTLVITSSDGVPCAYGYAPLIATGTLGTDSA